MKKIILFLLVIGMVFIPTNVLAMEEDKVVTVEYLKDGTIVETIIEESTIVLYSTQSKSGTKTKNHKNASGKILYTIKVNGTFTYNGNTSTCTAASATATSSMSDWKVISKSASKSGNKAIAKATMKQYYDGSVIQTTYPSVTLSCDKNGKLS